VSLLGAQGSDSPNETASMPYDKPANPPATNGSCTMQQHAHWSFVALHSAAGMQPVQLHSRFYKIAIFSCSVQKALPTPRKQKQQQLQQKKRRKSQQPWIRDCWGCRCCRCRCQLLLPNAHSSDDDGNTRLFGRKIATYAIPDARRTLKGAKAQV